MTLLRWAVVLVGWLTLWPASSTHPLQGTVPLSCARSDLACLAAALKKHAVRDAAYWQAWRERPLDKRMGRAPPEVLHFLALENQITGFVERPHGLDAEPDLLQDDQAALRELPTPVRTLLQAQLLGITFVEDLGSTGLTDVAFDAAGEPVGGFVVLDLGLLRRHTANSWASWKENTPFKPGAGMRLHATLEQPEHDNRKNAIQYILLHEFAHVLAIKQSIHPPWWEAPPSFVASERYPFYAQSWQRRLGAERRYASFFDAQFALRSRVVFYLQPRLEANEMQAVYDQLEKTNFTSLYGATGPGDDFAEAFASYVHVVLMLKPWQITLQREDQVVKVFEHCWDTPRCADKRALLEALLR